MKWLKPFLLLTFLFLFTTPELTAVDRSDREEFDLYWRNRLDKDFNRYDYPNQGNQRPNRHHRHQQQRGQGYLADCDDECEIPVDFYGEEEEDKDNSYHVE